MPVNAKDRPSISALDVIAVHPTLSNAEADALTEWYARREIRTIENVDALSSAQRDELLADYWRLLGLTAAGPVDALVRSLLGDAPDAIDVDDPDVAEGFNNARAAVRRAFERCELRAAGLLAIAITKRGNRSDAA